MKKIIVEKIIKKNNGYFVGFGGLSLEWQKAIEKEDLKDNTYKIKGINSYVGIWNDDEGKIWTEKSKWFKNFTVAYKWGKIRGEKAIWDCKNERNVWLKKPKGKKVIFHIKTKNFEYWIYEE